MPCQLWTYHATPHQPWTYHVTQCQPWTYHAMPTVDPPCHTNCGPTTPYQLLTYHAMPTMDLPHHTNRGPTMPCHATPHQPLTYHVMPTVDLPHHTNHGPTMPCQPWTHHAMPHHTTPTVDPPCQCIPTTVRRRSQIKNQHCHGTLYEIHQRQQCDIPVLIVMHWRPFCPLQHHHKSQWRPLGSETNALNIHEFTSWLGPLGEPSIKTQSECTPNTHIELSPS